ncbi:MAG: 23S rRNA (adenine(2030)-N(6))-methyltransferase RlmJ [Pseudomonadota bacterium]
MLSYQHIYHAGNLADVHKHALLAWMLAYLTRKDKPLSYIETHAGRALYDLSSAEAVKTGEAAQGIAQAMGWFSADDPYARALAVTHSTHGKNSYPGSPQIAATLLRDTDEIHLAELHPTEAAALRTALPAALIHPRDGFDTAFALLPPTPRRGLMLIDPSYEIKSNYNDIPGHIRKFARIWNVGIIALWYPILTARSHAPMLKTLTRDFPDALRHEVSFPPARPGHGMVGSGLFVIRPPFGLADRAAALKRRFDALGKIT